MPLFDDYLVCDWSAANSPRTGKDSIWIAMAHHNGGSLAIEAPCNLPTRHAAMKLIRARCLAAIADGRRLLAGFDFAFGYPAGAALAITGAARWEALWAFLAGHVEDRADNRSNRFELAAIMNERFGPAPGPFWGHPPGRDYDGLAPVRPPALPGGLAERRLCEQRAAGAQPVWKLAYAGAVGSQSLLGIARLETLRRDPALADHIAVWPFETGFAEALSRPVTIAEIYPSAFDVTPHPGEIKDAAQVRTLAEIFAGLDAAGRLLPLIDRPAGLSQKQLELILAEEGWIIGASQGAQ